jgi:hypothetical protein
VPAFSETPLMHYVILPLDQGRISARAELSGTDYVLDFYWNARQAAWLMSVSTADNVPIVSGITCTSNRYLLQRYRYNEELPPGELLCVDPTGKIDQANFTQLGREVRLLYVEPEEVV